MYECQGCGGKVIPTLEDKNLGKCESCGFLMPLPTEKNEKIINLFNKANRYRMNKEFDKAIGVYETILEEDRKQSDAYFGELLCLYGIEYVEDPKTKEKVMTCHKVNQSNVFDDPYYKYAIEYSEGSKKEHYENEAKKIDVILRDIIEVSNKEEPYDVFISYKDTEVDSDERTIDSVKASELYNNLTNMNLRVFYSRVSLEKVAGKNYEPYIYGALNTAKVMVVIGSKKEHFEAEWVKNEWSRYLKIIDNDPFKLLIPAYFDMSPKDLPVEFGNRQAMDVNNVSFTPDIIHIIKKTCEKEEVKEKINIDNDASAKYIIRAKDLLDDNDYDKALEIYNKALDENPGAYDAYLGRMFIKTKAKNLNDYKNIVSQYKTISNAYSIRNNYTEGTASELKSDLIASLGNDYVRYNKYAPSKDKAEFDSVLDSISNKYLEYHNQNIMEHERQLELQEKDKIAREKAREQEIELEKSRQEKDTNYKKLRKERKIVKIIYMLVFYALLLLTLFFIPPFSDLFKNFANYADEAMNFVLDFYIMLLLFLNIGILGYIFILNIYYKKMKNYGYIVTINKKNNDGILLFSTINSVLLSFALMLPIISSNGLANGFIIFLIVCVIAFLVINLISRIIYLFLANLSINKKIIFYIISALILGILLVFTCKIKYTNYYVYEGDLINFIVEKDNNKYLVLPKYRVLIHNESKFKSLTQEQFDEINNIIVSNNIFNLGNESSECIMSASVKIGYNYNHEVSERDIHICDNYQYNIVNDNLITLLDKYMMEE